jgi:hypothetical protein
MKKHTPDDVCFQILSAKCIQPPATAGGFDLGGGFCNDFWGQLRSTESVYADELAFAAFVFKFDDALDQGEERIVFAATDVVAGLPLGAALTCDDVAAEHALAAEFLEAQSLRMRIAAVS